MKTVLTRKRCLAVTDENSSDSKNGVAVTDEDSGDFKNGA